MKERGINITATVEVVVSKHIRVTIEGYRRAVQRLQDAISVDDGDGVYIAVTEAATCITSLADRSQFINDPDFSALIYARDRSHHQCASVVEKPQGGEWKWRPASLLPNADKTHQQGLKAKLPNYQSRIEGKPVLDVFKRLTPFVESLDP